VDDLLNKVLEGDRIAAARMITMIENDEEAKNELMSKIYPYTGHAYIIGVTGSPGAGKSTLTDKLVSEIRHHGLTVAIIAIDPTSPFSGGAILGDRIRMQSHYLDPGVFIRSMGTRGSLGGLSRATNEAVKVMDALGKDIVIIETVGVGQSEFDIMHIANTTLVVLTPGAGDAIQTIKAGIMEIADIFVVNKSDLEGSDRVKMEVEAMLDMKKTNGWRPPVVQTASISGNGFQELWHKILDHKNYLESSGHLVNQRKKRLEEEAREILEHEVKKHVWQAVEASGEWEQIVESLYNKEMDPYTAAKKLIAAHFNIL